jgi:DNA ligase (NAD+)
VALVDSGLVKDAADLYKLTKDEVIKLERFADISAQNLINAIGEKKHPELPRFIYGLGIRHVGTQTAIDLAEHFGSLKKLAEATLDELMAVEGVGDVVAESTIGWFADPDNRELLKKFEQLGVEPVYRSRAKGSLHSKSFVVTGTLESMGRDLAAERVRKLGGTFQSSVGQDTDYLVVGANVGESKLKKARAFGIKQITEQEFLKLIQ